MKTLPIIEDQLPTLLKNLEAALDGRTAFKTYVPGFFGKLEGPMLVAFGHGHPDVSDRRE